MLLRYLGNPENEFLTREKLATQVLGYKNPEAIYDAFTPDELTEINRQALEMRRKKYAPHIAAIDYALLKRAKEGDVQAIKLVFQRFEGWAEANKTGFDNETIGMILSLIPSEHLAAVKSKILGKK